MSTQGGAVRFDAEKECREIQEDMELFGLTVVLNEHGFPTGKAGELIFTRNARRGYWIVDGKVPLEVAQELYNNPLGKRHIRAFNHAGCVDPAKGHPLRLAHFDVQGKRLFPLSMHGDDSPLEDEQVRFVEDLQAETAEKYVTEYHIDTDAALILFLERLRKHGVIPY